MKQHIDEMKGPKENHHISIYQCIKKLFIFYHVNIGKQDQLPLLQFY